MSDYQMLTFTEAVKTCFRKYANFNGRASRSEYWWFVLFNTLMSYVVQYFDYLGQYNYYNDYLEYLSTGDVHFFYILYGLIVLIPGLAVNVRRLHDVNKSGWNLLWIFTIIGVVPIIYWSVKQSDLKINQYGSIPLNKKLIVNSINNEEEAPAKEVTTHDIPRDSDEVAHDLMKYKKMLEDGLISEADYEAKKKQILGID